MNETGSGGTVIVLPSERELTARLEQLTIPADAKALLAQLASIALKIGDRVLEAGRRILHFALETLKLVPSATFGMIIGATLSILVSSVPLLGPVLGPLLGPLLIAFGLGVGAIMDVREAGFGDRLRNLAEEFQERLSV